MDLYNDTNPVQSIDTNSILTIIFFRLFLGLISSEITAFYTYSSGLYISMITNDSYTILAIVEVVVVIVFSLLFKKLSSTAVTVLYFAYAFLNGFTLSVIFAVFEMSSIVYCFIATACLFGVLAYLGAKTDKDISNWGTILTVALLVGVVLTLFNLIIKNTLFDIVLDLGILFIFFGLTVYAITAKKL